ncbi:MAG: hypothetical protein GWN85_35955, partial [Gemmatimonadetes bacterium]|nr:hypothetical protein [Gemmatimonadota bacterium]NIS35675.1 hypothetical protein [Actinomycetota bacterium]NIV89991.1 hypothetical protein [Actinomycetota bacterium]NIX24426.1 hypothetical protein [Actinomycetota bacterium]
MWNSTWSSRPHRPAMSKQERQAAILDILRTQRVGSQDKLRKLLRRRGFQATQATVSRDL